MCDVEAAVGSDNPIPELVREGWNRFDARQPRSASVVHAVYDDPSPFVRALDATPSTFVHGDVKIANAGHDPDGRTILIDWALAGPGPACVDLAWYLSVNAARLPESKEATIARYRGALERRGRDTEPWWDRQLALCLLGSFVQMGWEKALGGDDEFGWWDEQAVDAVRFLP
jgi:thiamine kinase-like enzyme